VKGAEALLKKGAAGVSACATHAVFVGTALKPLRRRACSKWFLRNSIPL